MHAVYTGVSLSGKSTLARAVARSLAKQGQAGAVYDPLRTSTAGGDWPEGWPVFEDPEEFMEFVRRPETRGLHLFIDEAHHILGHESRENFWLLTEGRHFGLILHLMTQRPHKLHPDVRTNCHRCYMFRLALEDARDIGMDYGHSNIHKFSLDTGDFLVLQSGSSSIERGNVFRLVQP